eukprot:scaffold55231_cov74-Cyclotella_meneghiniana.AAC.1
MATWAQSLFTGENYNGIVDLRATTVKGYLEAAQQLLITAGYKHDEGLPLDKNNSKESDIFIAKIRKYESLPEKREIIDDNMLLEIFYKRSLEADTDSLDQVFFDWLAVGRYTGFRLSEWAQTRKLTYEYVEGTEESRAMINGDWLCFDKEGKLLDKTPGNLQRLYKVNITWRYQKNGRNGETISYWRDDVDLRLCPVRAAWRILMRASRLGIPNHEPIGQYFDRKRGHRVYINSSEVEELLRIVGTQTTGITDRTIINKMFGMHSLRVTACNELACLGVKDSFIQRRLRWRSKTFLDYLRNNHYTARQHNLSYNIKISHHDTELLNNLNNRSVSVFAH